MSGMGTLLLVSTVYWKWASVPSPPAGTQPRYTAQAPRRLEWRFGIKFLQRFNRALVAYFISAHALL